MRRMLKLFESRWNELANRGNSRARVFGQLLSEG